MNKLCIALLLLLTGSPIFSIIESLSLYQKGAKKIVCIGDVHTMYGWLDKNNFDYRDGKYILSFLKALGAGPVQMLLEANESSGQEWEKLPDLVPGIQSGPGFLTKIAQLVASKKVDTPEVRFTFADWRRPIIRTFEHFCHSLAIVSSLFGQALQTPRGQAILRVMTAEDGLPNHSFAEFFQEIDQVVGKAEVLLSTIKEPAIAEAAQEIFTKIVSLKSALADRFRPEQNSSLFDLANLFLSGTAQAEWNAIIQQNLDLQIAIADLGFVIQLGAGLAEVDYIVIYAGANHVKLLQKIIKSSEFGTVFEEAAADAFETPFTQEKLKELFKKAIMLNRQAVPVVEPVIL